VRGELKRFYIPIIVAGLALVCVADTVHGQNRGAAAMMSAKSIPPATVAVIDPETGTSTGGTSDEIKLAVGDIILFRFNFTPLSRESGRSIQGYLTEYIPPNTEVVNVRIIDENGLTIPPRYPGLSIHGCAKCGTYDDLPCTPGPTCDIGDGSVAQAYADTGIFFTADSGRDSRKASNSS